MRFEKRCYMLNNNIEVGDISTSTIDNLSLITLLLFNTKKMQNIKYEIIDFIKEDLILTLLILRATLHRELPIKWLLE